MTLESDRHGTDSRGAAAPCIVRGDRDIEVNDVLQSSRTRRREPSRRASKAEVLAEEKSGYGFRQFGRYSRRSQLIPASDGRKIAAGEMR
jgi:hypothetical protein